MGCIVSHIIKEMITIMITNGRAVLFIGEHITGDASVIVINPGL